MKKKLDSNTKLLINLSIYVLGKSLPQGPDLGETDGRKWMDWPTGISAWAQFVLNLSAATWTYHQTTQNQLPLCWKMLMTPRSISKPYPATPTPSSPSAPAHMTSAPAWAATTSNVTAARQTSNFHQMCVHSGMAVPCEFSVQCCPATHTGCIWSVAHCRKKNPCNNFPLYQLQQCTSFWPPSQIHQPTATCGTALSQSSSLLKSQCILARLHWFPV